ncbi:MAG: suppressor of fused domain protein [Acidobacteriota bacterium]
MDSNDPPADPVMPGWDAINSALQPLYGARQPLHWGTIINYRLGGPDPLDGISAYLREEPVPHWHFISFGFSELYEKESKDLETSGYGFELTFRLKRSRAEATPPPWVLSFLQNLARYVFKTGNTFARGHYMNANGPIALGAETAIRAVVFDADPELPPMETPNGHLAFLQVVGVTLDELDAIKAWNGERFLELANERTPLLVTDLARESILRDSAIAHRIEEGTRREGSSTASLFIGHCEWNVKKGLLGRRKLSVTFGANAIRDLKAVLPARLPHGRELCVSSSTSTIVFVPGDSPRWEIAHDEARITLPAPLARQFADALQPRAGAIDFKELPDAGFAIVQSEIRDSKGKVIEVVG